MPISLDFEPKRISRREYHSMDYEVMSFVFEIQSEFGRMLDEKVYQNELAHRCREMGLEVRTEVPIRISFEGFSKSLSMDLLLDRCIDYELKASERLVPAHHAQTLNYLLLAGMNWGKLVNMRPLSVEHEYVTTSMVGADRYKTVVRSADWKEVDNESDWFRDVLERMIADWGAFIEVGLYREAICHFLGGEDVVTRRVPVQVDGREVGTQRAYLLNDKTAFLITAVKKDMGRYERSLRKMFRLLPLQAMQWVNFKNHDIFFKTFVRK